MPTVRGTRPYNKQEKISPVTSAISGVLGLPSVFNYTEILDPQRETPKDMPGYTPSPEEDYSVSERTGKVCGEDHSYSESTPNSSIALQDLAETDEFSVTRGVTVSPSPLIGDSKVQYKSTTPPKGKG